VWNRHLIPSWSAPRLSTRPVSGVIRGSLGLESGSPAADYDE
jgi:hypothetical protein